jgi:hypothetical protein
VTTGQLTQVVNLITSSLSQAHSPRLHICSSPSGKPYTLLRHVSRSARQAAPVASSEAATGGFAVVRRRSWCTDSKSCMSRSHPKRNIRYPTARTFNVREKLKRPRKSFRKSFRPPQQVIATSPGTLPRVRRIFSVPFPFQVFRTTKSRFGPSAVHSASISLF